MKISKIIGRQELKEYFFKAYTSDQLSHAYVIEGEQGLGKKTMVNAFINVMLCQNLKGIEVCGRCQDCVQFNTHNHPDVIYVQPSKKTGYGVDDIREGILDNVNIRPYQSKYKIYVIESAEKMTIQAQNVLLKTIEEPPAYVHFFLLAENKSKLLPTVLSRCILLKMPLLSEEELMQFLIQVGKEDKSQFIPYAEGNIGKLLEISESEKFIEIKRDLDILLDRFIKSSKHDIINCVKILESYEDDLEEIFRILQIILREKLRIIYEQKRLRERNYPATEVEQKYYFLSLNLLKAKKQLLSNVNKNMILWNLFLL